MTSKSAGQIIGSMVVLLPLSFTCLSCSGNSEQAPDPATAAPVSLEDAQKAASTMLNAFATGDYKTAYSMRTKRCNDLMSFDDYVATAQREYGGKDLLADNPKFAAIGGSGGTKVLITTIYEHQDPSTATPRTWVYQDGRWQFDNC